MPEQWRQLSAVEVPQLRGCIAAVELFASVWKRGCLYRLNRNASEFRINQNTPVFLGEQGGENEVWAAQ